MEINKIVCTDALSGMKKLEKESVDLTLTSPPYDKMRDYNGFSFNFEDIATEIFRVTKIGGVLVWVVADQTKNFCESLTSFKQAIFFVDKVGFNLLDTMIYIKNTVPPTYPNIKRYIPAFEYMFVFSKGKPKTFNPIKDRENTSAVGKTKKGTKVRQKNGDIFSTPNYVPQKYGLRFNYWKYSTGKNKSTKDDEAYAHPAIFPEKLAKDHIISWSNPGDLVFDPMCGSGTTCKMAKLSGRKYLGLEIDKEYVELANKRVEKYNEHNS